MDGDAGMGKTTLADEVSRRARRDGWRTAWGACLEGGAAPAYWPWAQVLRDLGASADRLHESSADADPSARFRLFDEVIEMLRGSSANGLLIVLDDLHWADTASLRLLQVLATEVGRRKILALGLYRGKDLPAGDTTSVLSAIGRERACTRLTLGGLSDDEIARLAAAALPHEPDARLVRVVQDRSEGSPFFALELLRLVGEPGGSTGTALPRGVREVIGRRLDSLTPATRHVLCQAAVLGREFTVGELGGLTGQPPQVVLDGLDEARGRALVSEGVAQDFRFAHALIQEVAYADLPAVQRQRLHAGAAAAIGDDDARVDALAHHLRRAATLGSADAAMAATLRAARRARRQLAYEHAAFQLGQALELFPLLPDQTHVRADLLLELARCQFRSGAVTPAWASCQQAAELGRAAGDAALMADAATVLRGISNTAVDPVCDEINALCRETAPLLTGDPVREAKVLAQQAITAYAFASDGSTELSDRAVQHAEASGDPDARFMALQARQVQLVHPRYLLERLTNGEHAVQLGRETGRDDYLAWGHLWRLDAFWELGRRQRMDRELADYAAVVARMKQPLEQWRLTMVQACQAEMRGQFQQARALADQALLIGRRNGHEGAEFVHLIVRARIARLTGHGAEDAARDVGRFVESSPAGAHAWLAFQLLEMGRVDDAAAAFRVIEPHIGEFPQHAPEWIPATTGMAYLCTRLSTRDTAAPLYEALLPFADRQVVAGAFTGSEGPVARSLGMLAMQLGEFDAAETHLRAAVQSAIDMGSPPYEALTRFEIARLSLARGRPENGRTAASELDTALRLAHRLGMRPLQERISHLRAEQPARRSPLSRREEELAALVAEGMSNRQIAERLYLSERTVETHVRNILTKLDVTNRTQIASWVAGRSTGTRTPTSPR